MIPRFPDFKNIEASDRAEVESHTHRFDPYSDFNFTSLYAWDTSGQRMISELQGNLVVKFTDYATHEPFLSFLGTNEPEHTARTLIEYCKANGLPETLKLVPEVSVQGIRPSVLTVREDRDNFDYLLSVSALSSFAGGALKPRRNHINHFLRDHKSAVVERIDLANEAAQRSILSVFRMWEDAKTLRGKDSDARHEEQAVVRLFETAASHALVVTGIFSEGGMIAFSIDEGLPNQYCMGHFWKGGTEAGIFDFLLQKKSSHFESLGFATWNYQQDLGVAGLRTSKSSYQPIGFLKKYSILM